MNDYRGVIIEESLADHSVLGHVTILSTKVESVTPDHQTPWLSAWTLHTVEVDSEQAKEVADRVSRALDKEHSGSWYADFKNDTHHYIIFPDEIFHVDRKNASQYNQAKRYGIDIGIPEHQVDFHPDVDVWER